MDMLGSIQNFETAKTAASIQNAVAAKVMKTTAALEENLVNQLLGEAGIGNNINIQA